MHSVRCRGMLGLVLFTRVSGLLMSLKIPSLSSCKPSTMNMFTLILEITLMIGKENKHAVSFAFLFHLGQTRNFNPIIPCIKEAEC
ncbi:hypothetical protein EDB82DRAFT_485685 [Fusarium venenatum]|uniref:uncharacterized protein n=1 Tax=Fusarium venenatum TaxID=56646 RepID=UPI001DA88525|nr:hypothetical protein EDB82DRAFT_485685 [Fusarium venenatum]